MGGAVRWNERTHEVEILTAAGQTPGSPLQQTRLPSAPTLSDGSLSPLFPPLHQLTTWISTPTNPHSFLSTTPLNTFSSLQHQLPPALPYLDTAASSPLVLIIAAPFFFCLVPPRASQTPSVPHHPRPAAALPPPSWSLYSLIFICVHPQLPYLSDLLYISSSLPPPLA